MGPAHRCSGVGHAGSCRGIERGSRPLRTPDRPPRTVPGRQGTRTGCGHEPHSGRRLPLIPRRKRRGRSSAPCRRRLLEREGGRDLRQGCGWGRRQHRLCSARGNLAGFPTGGGLTGDGRGGQRRHREQHHRVQQVGFGQGDGSRCGAMGSSRSVTRRPSLPHPERRQERTSPG